MHTRMVLAVLAASVALAGVGCTPAAPEITPPEQVPSDGAASGSRLAPGLYDLEDGITQAVGTLVYRDIEGGFWAVAMVSEANGDTGEITAVIANGEDFEDRLSELDGKSVLVTGRRLDGASIRMAGPEIEMTEILEFSDEPGIAE